MSESQSPSLPPRPARALRILRPGQGLSHSCQCWYVQSLLSLHGPGASPQGRCLLSVSKLPLPHLFFSVCARGRVLLARALYSRTRKKQKQHVNAKTSAVLQKVLGQFLSEPVRRPPPFRPRAAREPPGALAASSQNARGATYAADVGHGRVVQHGLFGRINHVEPPLQSLTDLQDGRQVAAAVAVVGRAPDRGQLVIKDDLWPAIVGVRRTRHSRSHGAQSTVAACGPRRAHDAPGSLPDRAGGRAGCGSRC